jgi:hypothetical protein
MVGRAVDRMVLSMFSMNSAAATTSAMVRVPTVLVALASAVIRISGRMGAVGQGLDAGQHLRHRHLPAPMSLTMAEPTTQPSATLAMAFACSGVVMPKPTITGRSVDRLIRATSGPTSPACAAAAPVIPVIET